MTTNNTWDFTHLLAPINKKHPTGCDIRQESNANQLYRKIKDVRLSARTIERQQVQGIEISAKADWATVYTLTQEVLCHYSKDLEIAAWLIEALLREQGFAGLCKGFSLTRQLIELYWDNLYPLPDEDGIQTRIAPLSGLNGEETEGTLIAPIALVSLTEGHTIGPFSLWQYHQALEIMKIADEEKRQQRIASGAITFADLQTAASETSPLFMQTLNSQLHTCLQEFKLLNTVLEEKCAHDAPSSSRILKQLNDCLECLQAIGKETFTHSLDHVVLDTDISSPSTLAICTPAPIVLTKTREQILQSLLEAAEFFRRTEPHSPIPYILERAVNWAKLPLPQLLQELIEDEAALTKLGQLTGIKFK
jgi:type VI secretion system protein ImpA